MEPETMPLSQKARYRRLLAARKAELLNEFRRAIEELIAQKEGEDDLVVSHYDFISQRMASLDCEELTAIEAALDRIERGTYGICQDCGCPIAADRLSAAPWVACCGACKPALALTAWATGQQPREQRAHVSGGQAAG
jgi:RNA polymerase-binding transcription factor DksA